jgi:hypothetical protein
LGRVASRLPVIRPCAVMAPPNQESMPASHYLVFPKKGRLATGLFFVLALLRRLGTRRAHRHARQQRALDLIRKNRRPFSIRQQGPWRDVLRIQESADSVPVRRETVLNHQRYEKHRVARIRTTASI